MSSTPPSTRSWSGDSKQAPGRSNTKNSVTTICFPIGSPELMMGQTTRQGWLGWTTSRPMTTLTSFSRHWHSLKFTFFVYFLWITLLHLVYRLCPMSRDWGTFSWTRTTTRISKDHQEISAFSWWLGLPLFFSMVTSIVKYRFGELIRKLWNVKNFKAHVSPHEMLQAVVLCSKKKFQITEQVPAKKLESNLSLWESR